MSFDFEMVSKNPNLPSGYKPLYDDEPRSYQLSGQGMEAILEVMDNAGLLKVSFSQYLINTLLIFLVELLGLEETMFERYAGGGKPWFSKKIYAHKLYTNDGWYLSPSECRRIFIGLEKHKSDDFSTIIDGAKTTNLGVGETKVVVLEWLNFNQAASSNKGYVVC